VEFQLGIVPVRIVTDASALDNIENAKAISKKQMNARLQDRMIRL
jgi:hypothetical protein